MARRVALVILLLGLAGCGRMRFVVDLVPAADALTETVVLEDDGAGWGAPKIALIDVTGLIVDAERAALPTPGENPVARFVESLQKAGRDRNVKAVLVRVNSPGGTVTACDVIYRELQQFKRRTGKPVVILMGSVAASGGYYLACAGDEIIAHPTTITGSIGVIVQTFNFSEGMRKIGIKADAITSGPNKAMGSPFEPMPPEHRALLQGLVDEFYDNFLAVVVERHADLSAENLEWITDGRVVTGRKAVEVGLADRLGSLPEAFEAAKARARVARARLIKYHRPLEYVGSAYARTPPAAASGQVNLLQLNLADVPFHHPGFYYLWDPRL
ncbi:MAG: signal peptide peptidase SppA [Planctomycetota bacterium]|jgi:protease-4